MFSPVQLLIEKLYLASDEAFKKLRVSLPRHDICNRFKIGVRWPLFLLNHLQTVHMQALLSDTCCVHRAQCILLNLPLRPATVGSNIYSMNFGTIN